MKLNVVPARTGLQWVKLGIRTFFRQPLALAGLFFLYMVSVILVSQVPVLGVLIGGMLVPAATLGLMAATAEAARGRFPMPSVLLSAFRAGRQRARAMLVLGAIYTAGSMLATALGALIAGRPGVADAGRMDVATLVALLLHTPLFLMFWHAPALVHWHGVSPVKSLFFSAVAVLRNFGAHLVYGLGWLAVFLGATSLFGVLGALIGGSGAAQAVIMPAALLLAAMFSASIYFTFRDSFTADETPPATTTDAEPS
ncbi:BPSS1780 family membrane protein [Ramlibacter tataouinensis]|uniref:Candidate membrane protein n=1 Tax=Ramlibacter tataouinensis (strain ATCC BAA-407 / DSM 14655 / LMG 21543 / TTB310) TaxID=365046 RepID=F5Y2K6_RAMTT|nr:BPSS1780 family membrane protein [Ramlibacter tataouinensis]AEG92369.1 candidate membrane protein [Ramlibacter tataouinensis TTB310]